MSGRRPFGRRPLTTHLRLLTRQLAETASLNPIVGEAVGGDLARPGQKRAAARQLYDAKTHTMAQTAEIVDVSRRRCTGTWSRCRRRLSRCLRMLLARAPW